MAVFGIVAFGIVAFGSGRVRHDLAVGAVVMVVLVGIDGEPARGERAEQGKVLGMAGHRLGRYSRRGG